MTSTSASKRKESPVASEPQEAGDVQGPAKKSKRSYPSTVEELKERVKCFQAWQARRETRKAKLKEERAARFATETPKQREERKERIAAREAKKEEDRELEALEYDTFSAYDWHRMREGCSNDELGEAASRCDVCDYSDDSVPNDELEGCPSCEAEEDCDKRTPRCPLEGESEIKEPAKHYNLEKCGFEHLWQSPCHGCSKWMPRDKLYLVNYGRGYGRRRSHGYTLECSDCCKLVLDV
jgi:hypothetical protein